MKEISNRDHHQTCTYIRSISSWVSFYNWWIDIIKGITWGHFGIVAYLQFDKPTSGMIKSSPHVVMLRQPHPRWHFNYANSQGVCGGHQPCMSQGGNSLWCLNISVLDGGIVLIDCVTLIFDHVRLGRTSYVCVHRVRVKMYACVFYPRKHEVSI